MTDGARVDYCTGNIALCTQSARHAAKFLPKSNRHVQRYATIPKGLFNLCEQFWKVDIFGIELVEDDQPADTCLFCLLKDTPCVNLNSGLSVNDDGSDVHCSKRPDDLTNEIAVARGVKHMIVISVVVEKRDFRLDGVAMGFFLFVEIAEAGALIHAGWPVDGPCEIEKMIEKRRLSHRTVTAQSDIANLVHGQFYHSHCSLAFSGSTTLDRTSLSMSRTEACFFDSHRRVPKNRVWFTLPAPSWPRPNSLGLRHGLRRPPGLPEG